MIDDFKDQMKRRHQGQQLIVFKPKVNLNEREAAIIKWLTVIVKTLLSVAYVDDDDMTNFVECKCHVSTEN